MGTVTAGQSLTVNIPADTAWTVTTTGEATVFLVSGAAGAGYTSWRVTPTQPNVIAPFSAAGIIRIVGVSGVTTDGAKPPEGVSRARAEQLDALVSEDRITTWANRAALVATGLTTAFFTDVGVGGSHWDYVGGRWRPSARRVLLANLTAEQTSQATSLGVMLAVLLPPGLWQDGDILEWRTSFTKSGGTAETATTDWRIGASAVSTGLTLGLSSSSLATTQTQQHSMHRVRRLTATTARNLSATGANGLGTSTSSLNTRTIPNQDAADSYWQCLGNLSVGAETLTLTGASLYLESGA